MRMRHAAVVAGLALGLMSGTASAAVETYDFAFTTREVINGTSFGSFGGQLKVENNRVISIEGSGNQIGQITRLLPNDPTYGSDDMFSAADPHLTSRGFSFETSVFSIVNLYYDNQYIIASARNGLVGDFVATPVSTVPLPASAPMFGAALLAFGGLGYSMKRKKAVASA